MGDYVTEHQRETAPSGEGRSGDATWGVSPVDAERSRRAQADELMRFGGAPAPTATGRASNPRFASEPALKQASKGGAPLRKGSRGHAVRVLQQALIDAGHSLPNDRVDGDFDDDTEAAVKAFQAAQTPPLRADGVVGRDTMSALDATHQAHASVVALAQQHDPNARRAGTRALTPEDRAAFDAAITTAPRNAAGQAPVFEPNNKHGDFEQRVRARIADVIDWLHQRARDMAAARQQPDGVHDWKAVEDVAEAAKGETDRVFGQYESGPAFKQGVNLFDAWEDEQKAIANDPGYADFIAEDLIEYLLNTETADIMQQHGADLSRPAEKAIMDAVSAEVVAQRRPELLDIQISWPGLAGGGRVSLQRDKSPDDAKNRDFMWDAFATMIHEYIHTLEHADHVKHRSALPQQGGGLTLREGMCDYFTTMVWDTVDFSAALRRTVEGPYHEQASHAIPKPTYYASKANAERAVGVVGVRNAMAAFFLGHVDLIGA